MPRQLDRIQKAKMYYHHPLREEYEQKQKRILEKNKGFIYYFLWIIMIFLWIMIPGYFVLLIADEASLTTPDHTLLIIFLGIINLLFSIFAPLYLFDKIDNVQKKRNKAEIDLLKKEYEQKGLFEFTEEDLVSRCLDEDYDGNPICGITGAYIGYGQKYTFCKQPRNCLKCKTFMNAYLGNDWNGEYEME